MNVIPFRRTQTTKESIEQGIETELRIMDEMEKQIHSRRQFFIQMQDYLMDSETTAESFRQKFGGPW